MEWICAKQLICVTTLYDKENSNLFKNELYGEEIKSLIWIKTKAISVIAYAYKIKSILNALCCILLHIHYMNESWNETFVSQQTFDIFAHNNNNETEFLIKVHFSLFKKLISLWSVLYSNEFWTIIIIYAIIIFSVFGHLRMMMLLLLLWRRRRSHSLWHLWCYCNLIYFQCDHEA